MTPERRTRLDRVLNQRQPDLTVVAERLHKPRNFSAVIRTCDAVGIGEVHAVLDEAQLRTHWHTSQGAEKWVRVRTHETIDEAIEPLRDAGFQMLAAHLGSEAVDYREIDYTRPTALVIGTELFGVSDDTLAHVDREILIPMHGLSQSLNVSVACAVVLYEAQRQRAAAGFYDRRRLPDAAWKTLRFEWLYPKIAAVCRREGRPYPELDADGEII